MTKTETVKAMEIPSWIIHNNKIVDSDLNLVNLGEDLISASKYFKEHINTKTQYYKTVEEQVRYLSIENDYWLREPLEKYTIEEIESVFMKARSFDFRFNSFMSAFKFYNDYALRTDDKKTFLERYEDRLSITALFHADGDVNQALFLIEQLMKQNFTPATPTLLNSGRSRGGEMVSCFLTSVGDSLEDITKAIEFSAHLSKIGGGVSW